MASGVFLDAPATGPTIRVAHYGTGHTGATALRQVIKRHDLELVAHLVHTPEKVGRDSGTLVGLPATGVTTIADFDTFLDSEADCVTYFATEFGRSVDDVIDEMCRILASGKSLVTTTFTQLVYPRVLPPATFAKIEEACDKGQSAFFATGIAPGFTTDTLILACTSLCDQVRSVTVSERILAGAYEDPLSFAALGFGRTQEEDARLYQPGLFVSHFSGAMRMLSDALVIGLDEIRETRDTALADQNYNFPAGKVRSGTIGSVRLRFEGLKAGEARVMLALIYSMTDTAIEEWEPQPPVGSASRRFTRITIDGDPSVEVDLALGGSAIPGVDATASRAVNAIRTVCAGSPGVHSALDMPVHGAGIFVQ